MKNILAVLAFAALALFAVTAQADDTIQESLQEDGKGIIQDYSNMHAGDDLEWLWIKPGVKLSDYRYKVTSVENLTLHVDDDLEDVLENTLGKQLNRAGARGDKSAPLLNVAVGLYWTERANVSKAWIPFAGGHLAQAGVGVELVFTDSKGNVVAKIRHSAREGRELADAGREISDDIAEYVNEH